MSTCLMINPDNANEGTRTLNVTRTTGSKPATSANSVTLAKRRRQESNPQPFPYKGIALPVELHRQKVERNTGPIDLLQTCDNRRGTQFHDSPAA